MEYTRARVRGTYMAAYSKRVRGEKKKKLLDIDTNDMRDDILISAIDFKSIT